MYSSFPDPESVIKQENATRQATFYSTGDKLLAVVRPRMHIPHKKNPTLLFAMHMFEKACSL